MKKSEFYFDLPEDLIAQNPVFPRDNSRLMVLKRGNKTIEDNYFYELPDLIPSNSVLVINNTRVYPARLYVKIDEKEGELLVLKQTEKDTWECMVKPGKKFLEGKSFTVKGKNENINASVKKTNKDGTRQIQFQIKEDLISWMESNGYPPFPPYIKNTKASLEDYQTTYAKETGSVAAPTAGLHFTKNVFDKLAQKNIEIIPVTLHVGQGTFLPVKSDKIEDHQMHSEWYEMTPESAKKLNNAKKNGKKIIAVGTTSVRTLESNFKNGLFHEEKKDTEIFIYPGYNYKTVDGIITNFHLPESTLIMLVSAFAGKEFVFKAYQKAIKDKYRFYSFGDAMLII